MFNEMKMASIKKTSLIALAIVFIGIGLLYFKGEKAIVYLKGPEDITSMSPDKIENVDYAKIKLTKDNLFNSYSEKYETRGKEKHTVCYYFTILVGNQNTAKCMGVKVYTKHYDEIDEIFKDYEKESAGEKLDKVHSVTIKGKLKKMESDAYKYFVDSFKKENYTDEQINNQTMNLMVDEESINETCLIYPILGILCIVGSILYMLYVVLGLGQRRTIKRLKKKGPGALERAEEDFKNARVIKSNLKIGKYYTFIVNGAKNHIIANDEIVWVYPSKVEHRTNGVHTGTTYSVIIKTINKKSYSVNTGSELVSDSIMEIYNSLTRSIVLGYNTNLKKLFQKSFNEFLNICYNINPYGEGIQQEEQEQPDVK